MPLPELLDEMVFVLIAANTVMAAMLLFVYLKNYREIKSNFTLGLAFFSLAFFAQNILNMHFYNALISKEITYYTTSHLTVNGLEFFGLLFLLYVTWK